MHLLAAAVHACFWRLETKLHTLLYSLMSSWGLKASSSFHKVGARPVSLVCGYEDQSNSWTKGLCKTAVPLTVLEERFQVVDGSHDVL